MVVRLRLALTPHAESPMDSVWGGSAEPHEVTAAREAHPDCAFSKTHSASITWRDGIGSQERASKWYMQCPGDRGARLIHSEVKRSGGDGPGGEEDDVIAAPLLPAPRAGASAAAPRARQPTLPMPTLPELLREFLGGDGSLFGGDVNVGGGRDAFGRLPAAPPAAAPPSVGAGVPRGPNAVPPRSLVERERGGGVSI